MPTRMKAERPKKPTPAPVVKELEAGFGRCQEASPMSKERYIPCSAPATVYVGWVGRMEQPVRMCDLCADHNVRNRGGKIQRSLRPDERVRDEPKPVSAEVLAVQRDEDELLGLKQKMVGFLDNLKQFFLKAKEIEVDAKTFTAEVKLVKPATNGDEDAAIVRLLKLGKDKKEAVAEHWNLRKMFYDVNARMLDASKRPTLLLDEANARLQQLHNEYVAKEKRRADEAQRQRDEDARREEQARRDAELARMEAEAVSAEAASADLSDRETLFVGLYVEDHRDRGNGPECAVRAGFTADKFKAASRLLSMPKIMKAIEAKQKANAMRRQAAAVAAAPVIVPPTAPVERDIINVGIDSTRYGGKVVSEDEFFEACGIPAEIVIRTTAGPMRISRSVFEIKGPSINALGRELKEKLDYIPGLAHTKNTSTR